MHSWFYFYHKVSSWKSSHMRIHYSNGCVILISKQTQFNARCFWKMPISHVKAMRESGRSTETDQVLTNWISTGEIALFGEVWHLRINSQVSKPNKNKMMGKRKLMLSIMQIKWLNFQNENRFAAHKTIMSFMVSEWWKEMRYIANCNIRFAANAEHFIKYNKTKRFKPFF